MCRAAVLTQQPLGGVGGGCASSLSLQATKPRGNASLSIFLPRERWAAPPQPPQSLVLFQLPAWPELSKESELIVTLWVAFREFRLGLKKTTTSALQQSNLKSDRKVDWFAFATAMKTSQSRNETVFGISREHIGGFVCLSLESIFYITFSEACHTLRIPYLPDSHWIQFMLTQFENLLTET